MENSPQSLGSRAFWRPEIISAREGPHQIFLDLFSAVAFLLEIGQEFVLFTIMVWLVLAPVPLEYNFHPFSSSLTGYFVLAFAVAGKGPLWGDSSRSRAKDPLKLA